MDEIRHSDSLQKLVLTGENKFSFDLEARWTEDATDNLMVELESIRGNQWNMFEIHSAGYVSKESKGVLVASPPNDCRGPKPRPDLDHGEDPDRLVLAANNCVNLVCLKFDDGESRCFAIVEPTAAVACPFEPASNGIPSDSLYSCDCGLIQTFNAESHNLIEGCATVLESMVRRTGVRAECLSACPTPVSTTPPPFGLAETIADHILVAPCRDQ